MADFQSTLKRLAQGEVEFDSVAQNIDKLLTKKPQAAVTVMDELKKAVEELTSASHKIAEEMYKAGAAGEGAEQQAGAGAEEAQKDKEDVVEAEFEETDKDKKE